MSESAKFHHILAIWLIQAAVVGAADLKCTAPCGNVQIRFPYGIEQGCFLNNSFRVFCDNSFSPPKPFLTSINMELLKIISINQVEVNNPVISSINCNAKAANNNIITVVSLSGSPFYFSNDSNRFTAIGCNNYAMLVKDTNTTVGGCFSICPNGAHNGSGCYGLNCCQATIPPRIQVFQANMTNPLSNSNANHSKTCMSAFMVQQTWFSSYISDQSINYHDLNNMDNVPAVLEWGTQLGYCDLSQFYYNVTCTLDGDACWTQINNTSLFCICTQCLDSYQSCMDPRNEYNCRLLCTSAGKCLCPYGYIYYASDNMCYPRRLFLWENSASKSKAIIIGVASGLGFLLLLVGLWLSYKLIKRRQAKKLKQKFFKRNGGLLFEQQLSSTENHVDQTKLFTSKELEIATDNFHANRILGHGGQGTVYKGMLTDGRVVAVKKSKVVDEDKLDQFINEVVILSQINHRNVVKLFGCCLETEVPLLVYEFVPNGTLFQYLQHQNDEFAITWEVRLRIATEVAAALSYLHSAASMPIYHRDIKSSNILLDEKYRAKVADFGTSKSISIDQTHVTTRVQGTFGYLDPEYFQSGQFTEKSDVYSFGVVLVELLTGQKPISSSRSEERRSLATHFLLSVEEKRLFEIVDGRVMKEGGKREISTVGNLAKACLELNGKKRPTMKRVAMELEGIRGSHCSFAAKEDCEYEEEIYYYGAQEYVSTSSSISFTTPFLHD